MFSSQYEEHLAHSAPCSSRWDGFDRGDIGNHEERDQGSRVIGRMSSSRGRVEVVELWSDDLTQYEVTVDGNRVHSTDDRAQALTVGRWWVNGCPS